MSLRFINKRGGKMKNTFRQRVMNGLYLDKIVDYLSKGYYYTEIANLLDLNSYQMTCCIKYLYGKYNARNKINLVAKVLSRKSLTID